MYALDPMLWFHNASQRCEWVRLSPSQCLIQRQPSLSLPPQSLPTPTFLCFSLFCLSPSPPLLLLLLVSGNLDVHIFIQHSSVQILLLMYLCRSNVAPGFCFLVSGLHGLRTPACACVHWQSLRVSRPYVCEAVLGIAVN